MNFFKRLFGSKVAPPAPRKYVELAEVAGPELFGEICSRVEAMGLNDVPGPIDRTVYLAVWLQILSEPLEARMRFKLGQRYRTTLNHPATVVRIEGKVVTVAILRQHVCVDHKGVYAGSEVLPAFEMLERDR